MPSLKAALPAIYAANVLMNHCVVRRQNERRALPLGVSERLLLGVSCIPRF